MIENNKLKYYLELYDLFLKGEMLNSKLELLLSLTSGMEEIFKTRNDWLRVKFLINLKISERKLSSFDIDGCKTGLKNCYELLVDRKDIIQNSIEQLYSNEKSENTWKSDSCKLDLLALEVLILEDNYDTAQVLMTKCVDYGMILREECHLARLTYLAGSRTSKIQNIELSIHWLDISFSLGRRNHNDDITTAAGNLLLKLLIEQKDWRRVRSIIDYLPYSFHNQLHLLHCQIDEENNVQASNMTRNLLEKSTLTCDQAYQLLGTVRRSKNLVELINASTLYENWNKIEQEEWLGSLVCVSANQSIAYLSISNYIQWANDNQNQPLHRSSDVLKFADEKLRELYQSQDNDILEKWFDSMILLAQIGKNEEMLIHFMESLVALQLKRNEFNEAIKLLRKLQLVYPQNSKFAQLQCWIILQMGNTSAFPILVKVLQEKCLKESEVFWFAFIEMLSISVKSQTTNNENFEILFSLMADSGFFGSIDLLNFGVLIFCRLEDPKTVVNLLSSPSVMNLMSENVNNICSSMCWNMGLKTTDKLLRFQLLRLANQLLPPNDSAFFSTRLVSIAAGLSCLSSPRKVGPHVCRQLSTDILDVWRSQCQSTRIMRAALLYQFRFILLTEGQLEIFRSILRKLEEFNDVAAIETLSIMAANEKRYETDVLVVEGILKAVELNCKSKDDLLLFALETLCRNKKQQSLHLNSIIEQLSISWKINPNKKVITKAMNILWNAWLKHQEDINCSNFGSTVVVLYNLIADDKILSILEKPTLALWNRIRRILDK